MPGSNRIIYQMLVFFLLSIEESENILYKAVMF